MRTFAVSTLFPLMIALFAVLVACKPATQTTVASPEPPKDYDTFAACLNYCCMRWDATTSNRYYSLCANDKITAEACQKSCNPKCR